MVDSRHCIFADSYSRVLESHMSSNLQPNPFWSASSLQQISVCTTKLGLRSCLYLLLHGTLSLSASDHKGFVLQGLVYPPPHMYLQVCILTHIDLLLTLLLHVIIALASSDESDKVGYILPVFSNLPCCLHSTTLKLRSYLLLLLRCRAEVDLQSYAYLLIHMA
jgi:hypothetical protein